MSEKDNNFYIGFTKDLRGRLDEHQRGSVISTASRRPLELISGKEARARRNYRRFVEGGVEQPACHCEARAGRGRRPDLQENRVSKGECKEDSDSRILGDRAFIEGVLNDTDKVYRPKKKRKE